MKKLALCLLATTALASSACSVDVMGQTAILREQKRIPITSTETRSLTVRVFDGSLELRSWDRNEQSGLQYQRRW